MLRRHPHATALAVLVVASLAFRLYVSHACSLWLDEDYTHLEVRRDWLTVLAGPEPAHPPLFFVLTKLATVPFVYSETALRAVSLLSGCGLLVALYWLCRELGLTAGRALIVVALLAITPFFIDAAVEARMYALYSMLATLAVACVLRLLREPNRLDYLAGFALSAGAMAATHYFGLAYAAALLGALLLGLIPKWKQLELTPRRRVQGALVLAALLAVLGLVLLRALALATFYATNKAGSGSAPWQYLLDSMLSDFSFLGTHPWARLVELLLAAAGLVLLGLPLRGIARLIPFALTFCPCIGALFIQSGHFVAPRYLAPSWVLYHLGACVGLFALVDLGRRHLAARVPRYAPLAWAPVALAASVRVAEYPTNWGAGEDDYRGLQEYFLEHLAQNTKLVCYPGRAGIRLMFFEYPVGSERPIELEHFKRRPGVDRYLVAEIHLHGPGKRAEFERLIKQHFGLTPDLWRELPLLDLAGTVFQPPVKARLVVWNGDKVAVPPARPRRTPHRHHRRVEQDVED